MIKLKGNILEESGPSGEGSSDWAPWFYCPFKGYAKSRGLHEGDSGPALDLGSAVHHVEAHHYLRLQARQQGKDPDFWLPPLEAADEAFARGILKPLAPADYAKLAPIYGACHNPNQKTGKKVLLVERVLPIEIGILDCPGHPKHGLPIRYAPRLDLVEQDEAGGVWIPDHKTAARPSSTTIQAYSNHMQFIMLAAIGEAHFGDRFRGVKLHLIKTSEPYGHDWIDISITKFQVEAMAYNFHEVAHRRARIELEVASGRLNPLYIPRAVNEQVCQGRYHQCSAFDLCRKGAVVPVRPPTFKRKVR